MIHGGKIAAMMHLKNTPLLNSQSVTMLPGRMMAINFCNQNLRTLVATVHGIESDKKTNKIFTRDVFIS